MRIDVDIEELEIRGVEPQFGYRIGQAFERELTRLLGKHGLAALDVRTKVIDQIEAGSVTVAPRPASDTLGRKTAQALYGVMNK